MTGEGEPPIDVGQAREAEPPVEVEQAAEAEPPVEVEQAAEAERRAVDQVAALRTPLGRIELAASQLAREGGSPVTRELARSISRAVDELDTRIAAALRRLAPPPAPTSGGCGSAVREPLARRLAPVLAARGVALAMRGFETPGVVPEPFNRRALALLRAALADGPGRGARWQLALAAQGDLVLEAVPHPRPLSDAWAAAHAFAREADLELGVEHREGRLRARLRAVEPRS